MLQGWVVVLTSFAYLGLLFAVAYYADRRADAGRSVIASPYIYSLSLAVYATAWTFYGSVGRAASDGVGFLPIYIGPTLMIALWWIVMRKILRISKQNHITSLADFIASRYGRSALLGGVVTVIAVIGILPYISLQLKAVSNSFTIVLQYPEIVMPAKLGAVPLLQDTALWVALILAAFTIVFGTRHLNAAEHHEGMVAAIAFESLVKLVAFLAVGAWVTWGIYHGLGDLFGRVAAQPTLAAMHAGAGAVVQAALHSAALLSPAMMARSPLFAGGILVATGVFQWTPLKQACLARCRSPLGFVLTHWRDGLAGAFHVRAAPTVLLAGAGGVVQERFVGAAAVADYVTQVRIGQ